MKILRSCLPVFVVAALLNVGIPHSRAVNVQPPRLKSESQIRSEAAIYDTAIREISRIEAMPVATLDDLKAVRAIVERQVPNLKFNRSKLVSLGLSEAGFVSAVRAKTSDQAKADQFARELAENRDSIYRLSGAATLKDKIGRKGQADLALLKRVAARIEKAANEIKNKTPGNHTNPASPLHHSLQRNVAVEFFSAIVITSLVISVAMIVGGPLALAAIFLLATAAAGAAHTAPLVLAAALIVANVVENVGTEEGRSKVAECLAQADRKFAECAQQGALITAVLCMPIYLAEAALCMIKE